MDRKAVAEFLTRFEGNVPHMYRCTGGKVTVGVGRALESANDACQLRWRIAGQPATAADVTQDFTRISTAEMDRRADFYKQFTKCTLEPDDISALLDRDILRFEAELIQKLPNWSTYPDTVQQALFDMGYNLGVGGLIGKFPKMLGAVNRQDWEMAANECRRNGINNDRNAATAVLFRAAKK